MNRKTKIILIIILIILIIVGGLWMLARNKATKGGTVPPTFKEFVGLGSSTRPQPGGDVDNTLSSDFTNPDEPTSTITTSGNTQPTIPIATSIFTGGGFSPIDGGGLGGGGLGGGGLGGGGIGGGGLGGGGIGGGGSGGGNTGTGNTTTGPIILPSQTTIINPPPADPNPPECGQTDLYINFTQDELDRLTALKNRFFIVAETLNTDADVATEVANWDTFKTKSKKITELNEYCVNSPVYKNAKATVVATQRPGTTVPGPNGNTINYRVATPFWHDFAKDNQAFIHQGSNWMGIFSDPDSIFPERSIEHALRINLW